MAPATRSLRRDKVESLVDSTEVAAEQLVNGDLKKFDDEDEYNLEKDVARYNGLMADNSKLADSGLALRKPTKVPDFLRFPLVVILSLMGSGLAYSLRANYVDAEELGRISRRQEGWNEVGVLVAWKTMELALGWFGDYDGYDLAALSLLSHGPPVSFLFSSSASETTLAV